MHTYFLSGETASGEKTKWWNRWLEGRDGGGKGGWWEIGTKRKLSNQSLTCSKLSSPPPPLPLRSPPTLLFSLSLSLTTMLNHLPKRVLTMLLLAPASPESLQQYQSTNAVNRSEANKWTWNMSHHRGPQSASLKQRKIRPEPNQRDSCLHSAWKYSLFFSVIVNKWDGEREFICIHIK